MPCSEPPELTDDQISDMLDGYASPETLHHLKKCISCANRVERARRVEKMLTRRLFRHTCPPAQTLIDYHFKLLPPSETSTMKNHLQSCPHCQADLASLKIFLATKDTAPQDPVPQEPSRSRLRNLFAQLQPVLAQRGAQERQLPVLRGSAPIPLRFVSGDVTVFLELESTDQGYVLLGQVAVGANSRPLWDHALVELWQANKLQSVTILDDTNDFRCQPLNRGPLEVRITAPGGCKFVTGEVEFQDE